MPLRQEDLRITGHAIEARICAENPDNNFLPATGALNVACPPECVTFERGRCVDSGVRQGDAISPFYDSMVAKLIVHGDTREQAWRGWMKPWRRPTSWAWRPTCSSCAAWPAPIRLPRPGSTPPSFSVSRPCCSTRNPWVSAGRRGGCGPNAAARARQRRRNPFSRRDGFHTHGVVQRRFEFEFAGEHVKASLTYERAAA